MQDGRTARKNGRSLDGGELINAHAYCDMIMIKNWNI